MTEDSAKETESPTARRRPADVASDDRNRLALLFQADRMDAFFELLEKRIKVHGIEAADTQILNALLAISKKEPDKLLKFLGKLGPISDPVICLAAARAELVRQNSSKAFGYSALAILSDELSSEYKPLAYNVFIRSLALNTETIFTSDLVPFNSSIKIFEEIFRSGEYFQKNMAAAFSAFWEIFSKYNFKEYLYWMEYFSKVLKDIEVPADSVYGHDFLVNSLTAPIEFAEHQNIPLDRNPGPGFSSFLTRHGVAVKHILRTRKKYLEYPHFVHLETITACNADCTFCPYSQLDRIGVRMPDSLIEKIVDDLSQIPSDIPIQIAPYKVSDPFLEKRLIWIIRLIQEKVPNASVSLITNGSAMTEKKLHELAALRNVRKITVSLNDHRPDVYEDLMKIPFGRTIDRLKTLQSFMRGHDTGFTATVSRISDGTSADDEFLAFCKDNFPDLSRMVAPRNDWISQVATDTTAQSVPALPCKRWFEVSITSTGEVALCCMDGHGEWPVGDVKEQSVLDIYNQPRLRALREKIRSRTNAAAPCNSCTYL
ncbi:MAG: SPASM domain-containing protein [Alphaproteobacteria bacterium]|nr:SPASM domain-containing protein [Alphaproteobacteria bacterium]